MLSFPCLWLPPLTTPLQALHNPKMLLPCETLPSQWGDSENCCPQQGSHSVEPKFLLDSPGRCSCLWLGSWGSPTSLVPPVAVEWAFCDRTVTRRGWKKVRMGFPSRVVLHCSWVTIIANPRWSTKNKKHKRTTKQQQQKSWLHTSKIFSSITRALGKGLTVPIHSASTFL